MSLRPFALATWHCCRDWPIVIGSPVGRCGLCGERPQPTDAPLQVFEDEES